MTEKKADGLNWFDSCLQTCAKMSIPEETRERRQQARLSPEMEAMLLQSALRDFEELNPTAPMKLFRAYIDRHQFDIGTKEKRKDRPTADVYKDIAALLEEEKSRTAVL
ncbi:Hypothetical protein POVN_LOCUS632 [uncultured virus]|nr:Hypothetical protein POVN_LOCUS632 [uncultured virus]